MTSRAPKKNICRYFATSGTCFYGDQCQFQHVRVSAAPGPGPGPGPAHGAGMAPLQAHSNPAGPMSSAISDPRKRSNPAPHNPRSISSNYRQAMPLRVSNPPKHRGGVVSSSGSALSLLPGQSIGRAHTSPLPAAGAGMTSQPPRTHSPHAHMRTPPPPHNSQHHHIPRQQQMKVNSGSSIPTLQPPPASKQAVKIQAPPTSKPATAQAQVEAGGTTYFYSSDQQPSYLPDYTVYTKPSTHVARLGNKIAQSFFTSDNLRQDLLQRQTACLSFPVSEEGCPPEVDNYHSLCPLEPIDKTPPDQEQNRTFEHASTCYRAVSSKDGLYYCLRRIHGFRLTSGKAVLELEKWRKLQHINIITLKEMFTTKAFGDNSVVFVYDHHPGAESLGAKHFKHTKRASSLPEDLVWDYIIQLVSALRLVHGNNLALRCVGPTKILLTGKQRLKVNGAGIMDILNFDSTLSQSHSTTMYQQQDLACLGELLLCVALQSSAAAQPANFHVSMETLTTKYSHDLLHIIQYLLQSGSKGPPHSVMDILPMIGGRVYSSLERSHLMLDVYEGELVKELQNGRLFRLLAKLSTITERPEFSGDSQWAETGDRYLLKLFRDYLFHQVLPSGQPWVDLAHIVQTLNKLDAGVHEKIALYSRDEQSVLVVSYADIKSCLHSTFTEVLTAGQGVANHTHSATAAPRPNKTKKDT